MPDLWESFDKVWGVRNRHMQAGVPQQYAFYLKCCMKATCCHPLCVSSDPAPTTWFTEGPSLDVLPMPIPDPEQPCGGACSRCKGACFGHFLRPSLSVKSQLSQMKKPPSQILKEGFDSLKVKDPPESGRPCSL